MRTKQIVNVARPGERTNDWVKENQMLFQVNAKIIAM